MKFFTIVCLAIVLVPLAMSSPSTDFPRSDSSELRTGKGRIIYSWLGDPRKAPAYCKGFLEFTSKLVLTPLSGRSNLFGEGNHARVEYYLTIKTDFGDDTRKIIDIKTTNMKFLFNLNVPPTYDEAWRYDVVSSSSAEFLGHGYTSTGFYQSSGKLDFVDKDKKIIFGWRGGGDGFRIDYDGLKLYGRMHPATADSSVDGYCLTKWKER